MRTLQDTIEKTVQGLSEQFFSKLLDEKIEAQGVRLSQRERKLLLRYVRKGGDTFRIRHWKFWDRKRVTIDLTSQDAARLEQKVQDFVENRLPPVLDAIISGLSPKIEASLKRRWVKESHLQQRDLDKFAKRLRVRWGKGLQLLRMLAAVSRELGASIHVEVDSAPEPGRKHLFDALFRLHARACQITEEVICLLGSGFADGAMARWRTLHEIAVVALFVANHGEDLAERYVLHQVVESKRGAAEYEKCRERLGYEPLTESETKAIEDSYAALKQRFGAEFVAPYGWASLHVRKSDPTFADIERAVGVDHLRAHYRMASHNVHANPKGVFFKLGILSESQVLLAGPSNAGLADPGHATALSLAQVTGTIGLLNPTFDNMIALQIVTQLVDEAGNAFMEAHVRLESEEAKLRAG